MLRAFKLFLSFLLLFTANKAVSGSGDTAAINALFETNRIAVNKGLPGSKKTLDSLYRIVLLSGYEKGLSLAWKNLSALNGRNGNFKLAITYMDSVESYAIKSRDALLLSKVYNNKGTYYSDQGSYSKALDQFYRSMKIKKELKDDKGYATTLMNIGGVFSKMDLPDSAISYCRRALYISQTLPQGPGPIPAFVYQNLGDGFSEKKMMDSSNYYYEKGIEYCRTNGLEERIPLITHNLAENYLAMGLFEKSAKMLEVEYEFLKESEDKDFLARYYLLAGHLEVKRGFPDKAIRLLEDALELCTANGFFREKRTALAWLAEAHYSKGDYRLAMDLYTRAEQLEDSLMDVDSRKEMAELQSKFESDLKDATISQKNAELQKQTADLEARSFQRNAFLAGLLLVVLFSLYVLKALRDKKRSTEIILAQKKDVEGKSVLLEERNKEISDSINYAKRIQEAYLPPAIAFQKNIPSGFVLFRPKDVVSGDFFWLYNTGLKENHLGDTVMVAVADCTGHGVPGALMSIICCNALNEVIVNGGCFEPHEALNKVRDCVKRDLKSKADGGQKDGMDIALCRVNFKTGELLYAGANNPVWIFSRETGAITELKADKQPVGKHESEMPFTLHRTVLSKGDRLFLFSDGYADQFGGPKGKKFKYSAFRELFLKYADTPVNDLSDKLLDEFMSWKGSMEQVDDICVMGIEI